MHINVSQTASINKPLSFPIPDDYTVIPTKPPCEAVANQIMPIFRALVAKELKNKYGLSQNEIATKLGITQAAVSHYINSKRGNHMLAEIEQIKGVKEAVEEVSASIVKENDYDSLLFAFCKLCRIMNGSKDFKGGIFRATRKGPYAA
jgi:predicted transcriptional regulator